MKYVKVDAGQKVFLVDGDDHKGGVLVMNYPIDFQRIDSAGKLVAWIRHLSEKTWVTPVVIRELILAVNDAIPLNISYCV